MNKDIGTIPTIQSTKNYAQFQLMKGNRGVNYNHVKRLKREMQADPSLLPTSPILVNEHMFIIDGQHRRQAAQELGLPVYYVVVEGGSLAETRRLNSTQRRWTLLDFAQSYADGGRHEYKEFLRLYKAYPQLSPSVLRIYLANGQKNGLSEDFKRGELQIENPQEAEKHIEMLARVVKVANLQKINNPMGIAFLQLLKNPEFDYTVFIRKWENEHARERWEPAMSVRANLRNFEEVYNFQSKTQKRLY